MDDRTSPDKLELERILRLPEFEKPAASPDGETITFFSDRTGQTEIYLLDVATSTTEQLTTGCATDNTREPLFWGADGQALYFHQDTNGDEQNNVCRVDLDGSVETVISEPGRLLLQDVCDSGRYLLYTAPDDGARNLFRWDLFEDRSVRLTNLDQRVTNAAFEPAGGSRIAFSAVDDDFSSGTEMFVGNVDGTACRRLDVGDGSSDSVFRKWGPNGNRLLFSDDVEGLTRSCIYNLSRDDVHRFDDSQLEELPFAFLPDGSGIVGVRFEQAQTVPFVRHRGGEYEKLDVSPGVYRFPVGTRTAAFYDEQMVLMIRSSPTKRRELLAIDLATSETEVLYREDDSDDSVAFVDGVYETYESCDGTRIGGVLYEVEQTSGPGIVMVHGGPHSQSYRSFDPYVQYLVRAGYTVFQPNFRGSKGRGHSFRTAIHGDWGGVEQDDIAAAGRWLGTRASVDSDRIAIYGRSFGGYSVFYQLVDEPTLWAAGVAWAGITDLLSLYEEVSPAYRSFLRTQMGDPEENRSLWRQRSPLTRIDEQERPIMIAHGQNDPRCPVSQARKYRDALEDRGWTAGDDFEYLELESEGHDTSSKSSKVRLFNEMIEFLNERM